MDSTHLQAALVDMSPDEDRALARLCGVAISTVDRWRRGVAKPHTGVCTFIIERIEQVKATR